MDNDSLTDERPVVVVSCSIVRSLWAFVGIVVEGSGSSPSGSSSSSSRSSRSSSSG